MACLHTGATSSLLPYLTIHMQSIGLTVEEIAIIYLALPFTTFLSPPITAISIRCANACMSMVIRQKALNRTEQYDVLKRKVIICPPRLSVLYDMRGTEGYDLGRNYSVTKPLSFGERFEHIMQSSFLVDKFGKYKPVVVMSLLLNAIFHHSLLFIPQQEIPGVVPSAFVMRHPDSGDIEHPLVEPQLKSDKWTNDHV
uniref:Major facilitator superfamily associated domain-containing protein n=1 Tax=Glossina austeni TaxID=7395 RepID=A0A1A9UH69_GLOAU